jgi:hypothetical protein
VLFDWDLDSRQSPIAASLIFLAVLLDGAMPLTAGKRQSIRQKQQAPRPFANEFLPSFVCILRRLLSEQL